MHGFLQRMKIRNETHYAMEFSLEQLQGLCAASFPLHTSSASSNRHSFVRPEGVSRTRMAVKTTRSAPVSQSKRPPFHTGGGRDVGRFEGEQRVAVESDQTEIPTGV